MTPEDTANKAAAWRKAGIASAVVAVLAALFAAFSFHQSAVYTADTSVAPLQAGAPAVQASPPRKAH